MRIETRVGICKKDGKRQAEKNMVREDKRMWREERK